MSVTPYKNSGESKKRQIERMFDNISGKYDLLNHSLSLNLDRYWRRRAVAALRPVQRASILDVATGTGDMAGVLLRLDPSKITGVDLSEGMLRMAVRKFPPVVGNTSIQFVRGDSEHLPFHDGDFDAVTVAFGVRNFEDVSRGLREMHRVLRPGGQLVVLEFSQPRSRVFRGVYRFYFRRLLPFFGRMVSKDYSAYSYLPESVYRFPEGKSFVQMMEEAGFVNCSFLPLTLGVATVYSGFR